MLYYIIGIAVKNLFFVQNGFFVNILSDNNLKTTKWYGPLCVTYVPLCTYVNGSHSGVFQIGTDGEVDEIVYAIAGPPELVNAFFPRKLRLVPIVAVQHRPSAERFQHLFDRSQTFLFDFVCVNKLKKIR